MDTCKDGLMGTEHLGGGNGVVDTAPQPVSSNQAANDDTLGLRPFDWRARVRQHPYGMLIAAIGAGYVLGGGLFSRPTARLLGFAASVGVRLATLPVFGDALFGLAGQGAAAGPTGSKSAQRKKA